MARTYYTLCKFDTDNGAWFDEFGDYSRREVQDELDSEVDNGTPRKFLKIVTTDGSAAQLIAAVAKLNAGR